MASDFKAVVRNTQNNDLYLHLADNRFRNIRTLAEGDVTEEKAKHFFKINLEATTIINEYPIVADLINQLGLKIEK